MSITTFFIKKYIINEKEATFLVASLYQVKNPL